MTFDPGICEQPPSSSERRPPGLQPSVPKPGGRAAVSGGPQRCEMKERFLPANENSSFSV